MTTSVIARLKAGTDPRATQAWKPLVFDLSIPQQRRALEAETASGVFCVHDTLSDQLLDLAQIRQPRLRGAALEQAAAAIVGDGDPEEYGVWVLYPWSGRLVHVLDRAEFFEVRTDRNRNKITRAEQKRLAELTIGVVGLSVGQATVVTLAMEGVGGKFKIADFDTLSLSNLNRLRAGVEQLGVAKAHLTARVLYELNPFVEVEIFETGIHPDNIEAFLGTDEALDLVVEECDDLGVKLLLREHARARKIPVIMETSDRGMIDVERFDLEPTRPILHGLADDMSAAQLEGLTAEQKVPTILRIIGASTISRRAAASMLDVGTSLSSWPQLASSVALGGAVVTDVARRIALGQLTTSGRFYVDVAEIIADGVASRHQYTEPYVVEGAPVDDEAVPSPAPPTTNEPSVAEIRSLVAHGTLAPSGGNCQPWRFEYRDRVLSCWHDAQRSASLLDFGDVASYLAIGAAVENIAITASSLGLGAEVSTPVKPTEAGPVCEIRFARDPSRPVDALAAYVVQRVTNRKPGPPSPLERDVVTALLDEADTAGAQLQLCEDRSTLTALGEVIGRGERQRLLNRQMHGEMMSELRWTADEVVQTRDGLDLQTLEMTDTDLAGMRLVSDWSVMEAVRSIDAGQGLLKPSTRAVDTGSAMGLLTIDGVGVYDYFRAGRAMQRVWLRATALGLAFQPMTALLYMFARVERGAGEGLSEAAIAELRRLRARFGEIFDVGPNRGLAMLFRLAVAEPPTARSLRRRVDDVLTVHP